MLQNSTHKHIKSLRSPIEHLSVSHCSNKECNQFILVDAEIKEEINFCSSFCEKQFEENMRILNNKLFSSNNSTSYFKATLLLLEKEMKRRTKNKIKF